MQRRPGVTLVEVLVSALLLTLGIGGTLQAFATSARMRLDADRREALVGLLHDRLAWFEQRACTLGDSAGVTRLADGPELRWRVEVVGDLRRLSLEGSRDAGPAAPRRRLATSLRCD